ncbi:class I SAM-dependent methyltransferase [Marinactinospora endophytica]
MELDPALYGEGIADIYDLVYPATPEVDHAVDFVQKRCRDNGTVLEFGIGTGRIALPLAERGVTVHGVDASQRMLDRLAEKITGQPVTASLGDFATVRCDGRFDVVLLAINTFFMLPTQELQIACLENARRHLAEDGKVIIDVYEPTRFHSLDRTDTTIQHLDRESILLCSLQVDRVNQMAAIGQILMRSGEMHKTPEISRYAWPAEMDLMARIAGLRLTERWEDWQEHRFDHRSTRHVSVYEAQG